MAIDIQTLIKEKQHLREPLELYARWQRFHNEVRELLPKTRPAMSSEDAKGYPREIGARVFTTFAAIFELPEDFAPLRQAMEEGRLDCMRLPLDELPVLPGLNCSDEELARLLFLLSRPYFLALRDSFPLDGNQWVNGRCPLCSAQAALSTVVEGPRRVLHCSFCGTTGPFRFIGCPSCGCIDAAKLNTIVTEEEPGCRISTCDECHTYVKVIENQLMGEMAADLADLASLPLDIIAQEKGYARLAPNPISLKKME